MPRVVPPSPLDRRGFSASRPIARVILASRQVARGILPSLIPMSLILLSLIPLSSGCRSENEDAGAAARKLGRWAYLVPESFRAGRLERRLAGYDTLCIGVYRLDAHGGLYKRPALGTSDRALLSRLRVGRRLYPLISLRHARAGARLLRAPVFRARAVRELSDLVERTSYDGLHIDFEYLTGRHVHQFAAFLKMLKGLPVMRGRTLSIAAVPPLAGKPKESAFHDPAVLAPHIDEIVYMTYDYHLARPGPVTHLFWARQNIEIALRRISPDRVWLGVPAYGYEWRIDRRTKGPGRTGRTNNRRHAWSANRRVRKRPRVIDEPNARRLCARHGCVRHGSGMLLLKRPGRIAFVMDAKMRADMTALAGRLRLRGTALWRIGFEELE